MHQYGFTELYSLAKYYDYEYDLFEDVYKKFGSNHRFTFRQIDFSKISYDQINGLLTRVHEDDHFSLLSCTPVGLLIWRLYQALSRDVSYLGGFVIKDKVRIMNRRKYKTFDNWFEQVYLSEHLKDEAELGQALYIKDVVLNEVRTLRQFLDILVGDSNKHKSLTIGDFIIICNKVYRLLSNRCDLPYLGSFDSRYNYSKPLFGEVSCDFNVREILEAHARLQERHVLAQAEVHKSFITDWEQRSLQGVYRTAYNYIERVSDDLREAKIKLRYSLLGPIDLSVIPKEVQIIYVEDIFPWFVLKDVESMDRDKLKMSRQYDQILATKVLIEENEINGPKSKWNTYATKSNSDNNPSEKRDSLQTERVSKVFKQGITTSTESNLDDNPLEKGYARQTERISKIFKQGIPALILNMIGIQGEKNFDKVLYENETVMEYKDKIFFNTEGKEPSLEIIEMALYRLITEINLSILNFQPVKDPTILQEKIENWLEEYFEGKLSDQQLNEIKDMNKRLLNIDFLSNLAPVHKEDLMWN
ncbi:MAG: hypothetical protein AAFN93_01800 [Bacteroidota bacterium]